MRGLKKLGAALLIVLVILIGLVLVAGYYRSWTVMHDAREQIFLAGKLPNPSLDGFVAGKVQGLYTDWQGKKFAPESATGINLFKTPPNQIESFPFKTYVGKGLQDSNLDVLKIDYDNPINPWWVRRVVDEVVETAPGQYLGKIHLKIIPGLNFAVGYFKLSK